MVGHVEYCCVCAGCMRSLIRSTVLSEEPLKDGFTRVKKDWKRRPWLGVVPTRATPPFSSEEGPALHELPVDGPPLVVREYPFVCSRACLESVRLSHPLSPTDLIDAPADVIRDGDDLIVPSVGTHGPMPAFPSDEWID